MQQSLSHQVLKLPSNPLEVIGTINSQNLKRLEQKESQYGQIKLSAQGLKINQKNESLPFINKQTSKMQFEDINSRLDKRRHEYQKDYSSTIDARINNSTQGSEAKSQIQDPFSFNKNNTISRNQKLFQRDPQSNTLDIIKNPYLDGNRATTQVDDNKNDQSLLIIDKYESKESAKKRREAMKDIPFDVLYPFKPAKLLRNPDKNTLTIWKESKQPQGFIDKHVFQNKKDEKLAPNHYFKTAKKNDLIDYQKLDALTMFSTKKHLISPMPKLTLIDIIQKQEKKKGLGPGTYQNVEKGKILIEDKTGKYNGLAKSNIEQLLFIQDSRIRSLERPMPGHYKLNYNATDPKVFIPNLNRDKNPQRGKPPKIRKNDPCCVTYPYEKIDDRKVLSIRQRSSDFTFGLHQNQKQGKLERFIDLHTKTKKWIPAPSKYHLSMEHLDRYVSQSPLKLAYKK